MSERMQSGRKERNTATIEQVAFVEANSATQDETNKEQEEGRGL